MTDVEFVDNSIEVKDAINDAVIAWLYEASGELESQVKRNTAVDSGQLKSSWAYKVEESSYKSVVGSPLENAIWEEFGTGEYALSGDGRKTPWKYQDRHGNWHTTTGKRAKRTLHNAFESTKQKIKKALENHLKGLN